MKAKACRNKLIDNSEKLSSKKKKHAKKRKWGNQTIIEPIVNNNRRGTSCKKACFDLSESLTHEWRGPEKQGGQSVYKHMSRPVMPQ
jgi:hypothetical protein